MKYVVMVSGGIMSWAAARRVIDTVGHDDTILLFANTMMEDRDLYRFLVDIEKNLEHEIVHIADGRTPWQVFKDYKFLGNSQVDLCSRVLKRELCYNWIYKQWNNYWGGQPQVTVCVGIDWTEQHRLKQMEVNWRPYYLWAPLIDKPLIDRPIAEVMLQAANIPIPRLYTMGFPHNNCGGFCIKAGQANFKLLLEKLPDRYLKHEQQEEEVRQLLNKDVSILRSRANQFNRSTPLTLRQLRGQIQGNEDGEPFSVDPHDLGGCGCI